MKMSVGVSGNVPRLSISTILNDKLHLEYFREFLNFKDQRLITLHRGTVQIFSNFRVPWTNKVLVRPHFFVDVRIVELE